MGRPLAPLLLAAVVSSCRSAPLEEVVAAALDAAAPPAGLSLLAPEDGTVYPPGLPPPRLSWDDPGSDAWLVRFRFSSGPDSDHLTYFREWSPPQAAWDEVQRRSVGHVVTLTVAGIDRRAPGTIRAAGTATFSTSPDPIDGSIFYREVNLPFIDAVRDPSRIRWRFGSVTSASPPPVVLEGLPVCGNCHSFSADGRLLGMDIDYANDKGSYALVEVAPEVELSKDDVISWSDYRRQDGTATFGLLSQVSPDGRFVVSTVKDRSVFVPQPGLDFSQLFFPVKGILAVYDRQTRTFAALPGADDPSYVQSNPVWSPDGKEILFARAVAYDLDLPGDRVLLTREECQEFLEGGRRFRFEIFRIPFDGGRGGQAEPLRGACCDGRSSFFPRYSPDGRWVVFTKADSFMLLQPDSELYIVPAEGGEPRRMRANTRRMNSWHSFSPNGRWLVFSSKADGPYTRLYLTHLDEDGQDTPPVPLPGLASADRAANIPELVNAAPDAIRRIRERFLDARSFLRAGREFLDARDLPGAERALRKALELEPGHARAHHELAFVLGLQARYDEALPHHAAALKGLPNDAQAHNNHGLALYALGKLDEALAEYREAIRLDPTLATARNNVGIVLERRGRALEAIAAYREAVRLDPAYAKAHNNLGLALQLQGRLDEAIAHHEAALRADPAYAEAHDALGRACAAQGRLAAAAAAYRKALELDPRYVRAHNDLGIVLAKQGDLEAAAASFREALRLDPASRDAQSNLRLALERLATAAPRTPAGSPRSSPPAAGRGATGRP